MLPTEFTPKLFSLLRQGYNTSTLKADVLAGLTVAIVALPLSMALGIASGASPDKGLITAIIAGFTAGIAVIIASSQVKDFLGLQIANTPAEFVPKWQAYFLHMDTIDFVTFAIGLLALIIIIGLKRVAPKWPGYLIAVILTSLSVYWFHLQIDTVGSRFPDIPAGLPIPSWPQWDMDKFMQIIPSAFTIAFLAGIEALLSATVADGMTGYKHKPNQELVGQGVANIASVFFGGLPATGAIARTATNIKSGGKTPMAGIFHALFILIFVLFLTKTMVYIPLTALSAILFIVAWNMSEAHHFAHIFRLSRSDRAVMILTFALTVLVDLTVAIGIGVTLASLLFMHEMSRTISLTSQGRHIRDNDTTEEGTQRDDLPSGVEVFRFTGPLFFGVANTMIDTLKGMGEMPHILILRMKLVPYMDVAGLNALSELITTCEQSGSIVIISGLQGQPEKMLAKAGFKTKDNALYITPNYDQAIALSLALSQKQ